MSHRTSGSSEFSEDHDDDNPFPIIDRQRTSRTNYSRIRSNEFSQDHELIHQLFEDLRNDKISKNYKEIARSLVALVDLLRDMTVYRDEYQNYDSAQLDKAKT